MLDTLDTREAPAREALHVDGATETVETFEVTDRTPERTGLAFAPVAQGFAFLAGGAMLGLGIVGLGAALTGYSTLLNLFHVSTGTSIIHILTGLAGLAAWRSQREGLAVAFAVVVMFAYVWIFSEGNLAFGFSTDTVNALGPRILGLLPVSALPVIAENGLHVTLAMAGLIVAGIAALQEGTRATMRQRGSRVVTYRSRTRLTRAA